MIRSLAAAEFFYSSVDGYPSTLLSFQFNIYEEKKKTEVNVWRGANTCWPMTWDNSFYVTLPFRRTVTRMCCECCVRDVCDTHDIESWEEQKKNWFFWTVFFSWQFDKIRKFSFHMTSNTHDNGITIYLKLRIAHAIIVFLLKFIS